MRIRQITVLLCLPLFLAAQTPQLEEITIEDDLSQGMVHAILQTQDDFLWVATKDGLNRYNGYDFKLFTQNPYNPFSIAENEVFGLFEDSRGWMWVGFRSVGVDLYHSKTGKFFHLKLPKGNNWREAIAFAEDGDGNIWVGSKGALVKLEVTDDVRKNIHTLETPWLELPQTDVSHVLEFREHKRKTQVRQLFFPTAEDQLLIGTNNGYLRLNTKDFTLQKLDAGETNLLSKLGLFAPQANGRIWLTENNQLAWWEKEQLYLTGLPLVQNQ